MLGPILGGFFHWVGNVVASVTDLIGAVVKGLLTMVGGVVGAHRWILGSAETFGELVESTFDLYRRARYEAVRWPLPATPAEEQATGRALTEYLCWGSVAETPFARPGG